MASKTASVGNSGNITIYVDLVSQSIAGNTSNVRVRGVLTKDSGTGTSFSNNDVSYSISGEDSYSTSGPFSVSSGGSDTVIDRTFTVPHSSTGYKTVTYTFTLGATGTSGFGNGGSVSVSLGLPRIPKAPAQISTPTVTFFAPTTVRVTWIDPDNNGSAILEYQVQADDVSTFASPSTASDISPSANSHDVRGCSIGKTWYFRVRARNAVGWGAWSGFRSFAVPDVPDAPPLPTLIYTPPTTVSVDWLAPNNGGATITGYDVQYYDAADYTGTQTIVATSTTTDRVISGVEVGKTWAFRVRAKNSQGSGPWSAAATVFVVCGPRVKYQGVWRNTIAYVKVGSTWKVAVPYVYSAGVWKVGAG